MIFWTAVANKLLQLSALIMGLQVIKTELNRESPEPLHPLCLAQPSSEYSDTLQSPPGYFRGKRAHIEGNSGNTTLLHNQTISYQHGNCSANKSMACQTPSTTTRTSKKAYPNIFSNNLSYYFALQWRSRLLQWRDLLKKDITLPFRNTSGTSSSHLQALRLSAQTQSIPLPPRK